MIRAVFDTNVLVSARLSLLGNRARCLVLEFNDESNPLLFFYAFLMDYLAEQRLVAYLPSDLLAVWRKKAPSSKNESHP